MCPLKLEYINVYVDHKFRTSGFLKKDQFCDLTASYKMKLAHSMSFQWSSQLVWVW